MSPQYTEYMGELQINNVYIGDASYYAARSQVILILLLLIIIIIQVF